MLKNDTVKREHWYDDTDWGNVAVLIGGTVIILALISLLVYGAINTSKQDALDAKKATQFCAEKNMSYNDHVCDSDVEACIIKCSTEEADAQVDKRYTVNYKFFN